MVLEFKKIQIIALFVLSFFYSASQTDSIIRICFHADTAIMPDFYFNYIKIDQDCLKITENWTQEIKYISPRQTKNKIGCYSQSGAILLLSKEVLIINDSIVVKSMMKKKKLNQLFINHKIIKLTKINKTNAVKKYSWWRGRHGAIIIETKEVQN